MNTLRQSSLLAWLNNLAGAIVQQHGGIACLQEGVKQ